MSCISTNVGIANGFASEALDASANGQMFAGGVLELVFNSQTNIQYS